MTSSEGSHFVSSVGIDTSELSGGYKTVLRGGAREDLPYVVELAENFLKESRESKPSIKKWDRAAKKLLQVAYPEAEDEGSFEYGEAVASGLIEPYDEDRQGDRLIIAGMVARDIIDGKVISLVEVPEFEHRSE